MNKIKISKDDIELFKLTEFMLYESYKNIDLSVNKSADNIAMQFKKFVKDDDKVYEHMYNYAKLDIKYMSSLAIITNMYNTFEQCLRKILKIKARSKENLVKLCNETLKKFDYKFEENSFYKTTEKYRKLNNSIKHGKINKEIIDSYPELINKNCKILKVGTILDNTLNITEDNIIECCNGFISFIDEMYTYFEDNGYVD